MTKAQSKWLFVLVEKQKLWQQCDCSSTIFFSCIGMCCCAVLVLHRITKKFPLQIVHIHSRSQKMILSFPNCIANKIHLLAMNKKTNTRKTKKKTRWSKSRVRKKTNVCTLYQIKLYVYHWTSRRDCALDTIYNNQQKWE